MKTDDLIGLLSTGITPVDQGVLARPFGAALLLAALAQCFRWFGYLACAPISRA